MDRSLKSIQTVYGQAFEVDRQRVLRNTYALLALSMVPTVLGAWLGLALHMNQLMAGSPGMSMLLFFGISMGFFVGIERTKTSATGVMLLLGFTFFMGMMLSRLLGFVLGLSNGVALISLAFGGTALVFGAMASLASTMRRDLSSLGRWLFMGVMVLIVASIANIWLQLPALMLAVSTMAVFIFSAFILYDLKRIVDGGETNYVTATLSVYLDVYNVFVALLQLFAALGGSSDD